MGIFDDDQARSGYAGFLNGDTCFHASSPRGGGGPGGFKTCQPIGTGSLWAEQQTCQRALFNDLFTPLPNSFQKILDEMVAEALERDEAENELELFRKTFGAPLSAKGRAYAYRTKGRRGRWVYRVDEYLKDRTSYFGSTAAYRKAKTDAKKELDAKKEYLRRLVEPNHKKRRGFVRKKIDWKAAQDVFYTWLTKAYQKKYSPTKIDVAKMIKQGASPKLRKALRQVQSDYGRRVSSGGFNPRPIKLAGKYRLGTLSEHATGMAIDIEARNNPQIKAGKWRLIEKYTAKDLTRTIQRKWKRSPKTVFDKVKEINDEWVDKLAKAVKAAETSIKKESTAAARIEAAKKSKTGEAKARPAVKKKEDALTRAIKDNVYLKKIYRYDRNFIKTYRKGFFTLDWKLIKELHEEGFLWGATFGNIDLHHFELK